MKNERSTVWRIITIRFRSIISSIIRRHIRLLLWLISKLISNRRIAQLFGFEDEKIIDKKGK